MLSASLSSSASLLSSSSSSQYITVLQALLDDIQESKSCLSLSSPPISIVPMISLPLSSINCSSRTSTSTSTASFSSYSSSSLSSSDSLPSSSSSASLSSSSSSILMDSSDSVYSPDDPAFTISPPSSSSINDVKSSQMSQKSFHTMVDFMLQTGFSNFSKTFTNWSFFNKWTSVHWLYLFLHPQCKIESMFSLFHLFSKNKTFITSWIRSWSIRQVQSDDMWNVLIHEHCISNEQVTKLQYFLAHRQEWKENQYPRLITSTLSLEDWFEWSITTGSCGVLYSILKRFPHFHVRYASWVNGWNQWIELILALEEFQNSSFECAQWKESMIALIPHLLSSGTMAHSNVSLKSTWNVLQRSLSFFTNADLFEFPFLRSIFRK